MSEVTVRLATEADLDVVAVLFDDYRQFYGRPAEADTCRAFMAERLTGSDAVVLLAEASAVAVGFAQLYPLFSSVAARRIWLLNDLFVRPDARRAGVGRTLLDAARRHAVATGAARLELATAHTNAEAQRLYESAGYVRDTVFVRYRLEV